MFFESKEEIIKNLEYISHKPILCFDYGKKRIGLAYCDENWKVAIALKVIEKEKQKALFPKLEKIITDFSIGALLFGFPLTLDNKIGRSAQAVKDFSKEIGNKFSLPCIYWDESFSSKIMHQKLYSENIKFAQQKKNIDMLAAQYILADFIEIIGKK